MRTSSNTCRLLAVLLATVVIFAGCAKKMAQGLAEPLSEEIATRVIAPPLELSLTVGEFHQSYGRWPTNYAELCSYSQSAHDMQLTNYDRVDFMPTADGGLEISAFASGITNHIVCHPNESNQK